MTPFSLEMKLIFSPNDLILLLFFIEDHNI